MKCMQEAISYLLKKFILQPANPLKMDRKGRGQVA